MWRNWSRSVSCTPQRIAQPGDVGELRDLVRGADGGLRVAGAGHSFTPLVATNGVMVSLDRMQGVIAVDTAGRTARIQAGTRLFHIGAVLATHGLAMENLGDINVQSIAGATSTGTHGTGAALPNLASQIVGFRLMTATGDEVEVTAETDPDLFAGGRVALGALGILTDITVRLVPAHRLHLQRYRMRLDDCLDQADALAARHRSFEFYWLPHTEAVLAKSWDLTEAPADRAGVQRFLTETVLENAVLGGMCAITRRLPATIPAMARLCAALVDNSGRVDDNYSVLSTVRSVRFNESEWALPAHRGVDALREIKAFITTKKVPVLLPLEYRWVRGDDLWLSPNYQRDSVHISVHQQAGMAWTDYFDGVQAICRNHGGRPHWGKIHSLTATELAKLYPRWDDFLALRERMDPYGRFLNPALRALFGQGAAIARPILADAA